MKFKIEDFLKGGIDIDKMIELAEKEIKQWQKFLKELKRQKAMKKNPDCTQYLSDLFFYTEQAIKNNAGDSLPKRK